MPYSKNFTKLPDSQEILRKGEYFHWGLNTKLYSLVTYLLHYTAKEITPINKQACLHK